MAIGSQGAIDGPRPAFPSVSVRPRILLCCGTSKLVQILPVFFGEEHFRSELKANTQMSDE